MGVIGGSGFYTFFDAGARSVEVETPYGPPSAPITVGAVGDHEVAFLPRHGPTTVSRHTVPYRANMWALRGLGVRRIFAPCAVGSLTTDHGPGAIVVPDQLVDRTRQPRRHLLRLRRVHVASPIPTARHCVGGHRPARGRRRRHHGRH